MYMTKIEQQEYSRRLCEIVMSNQRLWDETVPTNTQRFMGFLATFKFRCFHEKDAKTFESELRRVSKKKWWVSTSSVEHDDITDWYVTCVMKDLIDLKTDLDRMSIRLLEIDDAYDRRFEGWKLECVFDDEDEDAKQAIYQNFFK